MTNQVKIKRSTTNLPVSPLPFGEFAYSNINDKSQLFIGDANENPVLIGSSNVFFKNVIEYTTSGIYSYTPTIGTKRIKIILVSGGGGGASQNGGLSSITQNGNILLSLSGGTGTTDGIAKGLGGNVLRNYLINFVSTIYKGGDGGTGFIASSSNAPAGGGAAGGSDGATGTNLKAGDGGYNSSFIGGAGLSVPPTPIINACGGGGGAGILGNGSNGSTIPTNIAVGGNGGLGGGGAGGGLALAKYAGGGGGAVFIGYTDVIPTQTWNIVVGAGGLSSPNTGKGGDGCCIITEYFN